MNYRGILAPAYDVADLLNMATGEQVDVNAKHREAKRIEALIEWDGGAYGEPIYVRYPASLKDIFEQTEMFQGIITLPTE